MAHFAKDAGLCAMFKSGQDPFMKLASEFMGKPADQVRHDFRLCVARVACAGDREVGCKRAGGRWGGVGWAGGYHTVRDLINPPPQHPHPPPTPHTPLATPTCMRTHAFTASIKEFDRSGTHSQRPEHLAAYVRLAAAQVTPEDRAMAKKLCYGILYGMGTVALSKHLNCDVGTASSHKTRFLKTRPAQEKWLTDTIQMGDC